MVLIFVPFERNAELRSRPEARLGGYFTVEPRSGRVHGSAAAMIEFDIVE